MSHCMLTEMIRGTCNGESGVSCSVMNWPNGIMAHELPAIAFLSKIISIYFQRHLSLEATYPHSSWASGAGIRRNRIDWIWLRITKGSSGAAVFSPRFTRSKNKPALADSSRLPNSWCMVGAQRLRIGLDAR